MKSAGDRSVEQLGATRYPMSFAPGDLLCAQGGESPEYSIIEEGPAVITYAISRERRRALVAGDAAARAWMLEEIAARSAEHG
jgi:hypothetical protein